MHGKEGHVGQCEVLRGRLRKGEQGFGRGERRHVCQTSLGLVLNCKVVPHVLIVR